MRTVNKDTIMNKYEHCHTDASLYNEIPQIFAFYFATYYNESICDDTHTLLFFYAIAKCYRTI